jgi:hypothetical protein
VLGLKIINPTGSPLTPDEINFAHLVANTHKEMRVGQFFQQTDDIQCQYDALKCIAYVTSSPLKLATIYQDESGIFLHYPPYRADKEEIPGSTVYIAKNQIRLDGFGLPDDISFADLRIDGKTLVATTNQQVIELLDSRELLNVLYIGTINTQAEENEQVITPVVFPDEAFPDAVETNANMGLYQSIIAPNGTVYVITSVNWQTITGNNETLALFVVNPATGGVVYSDNNYMSDWNGGAGALTRAIFGYQMLTYVSNGGMFSGMPLYYRPAVLEDTIRYQFFKNTSVLYSRDSDLDLGSWDWSITAVPGDVFDVSASPDGEHWIGAFSDPIDSRRYDASGAYVTPFVYVVVDGVEHQLTIDCVVNDLIADSSTSFDTSIRLSKSILSRVLLNVPGGLYRDQNKLAISDSGNWAACLLTTGVAQNAFGRCTTNIVHVINGVVFEHVERVQNASGLIKPYIDNAWEYLAMCRAYISPDDEIALIVSPIYTNRDIGDDISTSDPGFSNNVVDDRIELFIYSLATNSLITSHIYESDSNANVGAVARVSNRCELVQTATGYRLERIDDGYFYIDITVTEEDGGGKTYSFSDDGVNFPVSNGDGSLDDDSRTTSIDSSIHRPVTKIR